MKLKLFILSCYVIVSITHFTLTNCSQNDELLEKKAIDDEKPNAAFLIMSLLATASSDKRTQLVHDMKNNIANELTCTSCRMVVEIFKKFLRSEVAVRDAFISFCTLLKFGKEKVCSGIGHIYSKQFHYIVQTSDLSAKEICAVIFSSDCMTASEYRESKLFWELNLPNKTEIEIFSENIKTKNFFNQNDNYILPLPKQKPNNLDIKKRMLHLSDIHYDSEYSTNSNSHCGEPLCCSKLSPSTSKSSKTGYWGSYGNCDSPKWTIEEAFDYINVTFKNDNFDYVIFTGDIAPHNLWNTTQENILKEIRVVNNFFSRYFINTKYLFPVIGNHEAMPVNLFPPPEVKDKFSLEWLYNELYSHWKQWIPDNQVNNFITGGYYSREISNKLKVIVLNTNFGAKLNFWQLVWHKDLGNQLTWLISELDLSERKQQFVHIIGHVSPDNKLASPSWLYNYLRILERYRNTIKASFFGHTHFDEIRIYHSIINQQPIGIGYIGGSLTTYEDVNPMFRIYNLDDQGTVDDYETHYFNITEANEKGNLVKPKWKYEYSPINSYSLSSLSATQWETFLNEMVQDDKYFDLYYTHYHRSSDEFSKLCRGECKEKIIKSINVTNPIV